MNEQVLKEEIAMLESNNRAMQEEMCRTWEKHDKLLKNWNELKEWLEDNWKQSQDIWFVKIINKMEELEKESDVK